MTWSTQADLPLLSPASAGARATPSRPPDPRPDAFRGNRRPWPGVSVAKGAQPKGQALAARNIPGASKWPKTTPTRSGGARDLLTYVAMADVSPEVREALASFGRTIEAGFLARQQTRPQRQAWWNRD